ncbi:MAG: glycosyltransferase [Sulfurimonas sp.]|nr:glycosyltransferase [Sulfurimonas sp.]MDD5203106.1 glycosyltransferase [Sulfurimonas sp.]
MSIQNRETQKKAPTAVICLSPNRGGMELAAIKLAKTLSKYVNITVIAQKDKFIHEQCLSNQDYNDLKLETIAFSSNLSLSIIIKARKIIQQNGIKNVIFVGASELKSLYFAFLGLEINLIVRHGTTKSTPKKDFFHKLIYSDVAAHVAISKHLEKNVAFIVPFGTKTKLTTIVPSMPKPRSLHKKESNNKLQLIHVGRITPGKGLKEALLACEILYKNDIAFDLNSYGGMYKEYQNEFEAFVTSLEYKESFHLVGFTNDIYNEYPKHDIFIFPTKGEGFGNVMMEAIAHGIIILAFDNTAISNFKEMGFHIHLVKDGSVTELQKQLLYIAKNLDGEITLAQQNIQKAERIFSAQREAEDYLKLLK